jgi:hypothetical protein
MILNIIICLVIPWIFGVVLYFLDKKTLLVIAPFFGVIAYTVNEFGFHLNLWRLAPVNIADDLTSLTANIGLYPILAAYLIFFIQRKKGKAYLIILIFTLLTTLLEYFGVLLHAVQYGNGWNIGWTFLSYLIPYLLAYWYYKKLKKIGVF